MGESDKIVVFYSVEHGKIRGMAKAARRPRSRFGSSLEVGTEVELVFFEKPSRELVSIDRCDIVCTRFSRLGEPILATTLGYLSDLVDALTPERDPNQRLYRLLRATIGALDEPRLAETRARYFEVWLLRLSGLFPLRRTCPSCGRALKETGARYLTEEHRLECGDCLSSGLPLSRETVDFLEDVIWKSPPGETLTPESGTVLSELGSLSLRIVQEHLDKELKSHRVFEDMLRRTKP